MPELGRMRSLLRMSPSGMSAHQYLEYDQYLVPVPRVPPVPGVGGEEELVVVGGDDQLGHQQLLPVLVAVDNVEHVLHTAQQFGHRCNMDFHNIWRGGLAAQFLKTLLWNGVPISVVLCTLPI